ncbi:response regulator [Roseateles koreensis]|uniref:Response regulator n=1 Tax=Roseateles koreensis TaxID=2987526 RepID=A0ABT5KR74_9BURK|nr:response regulator [Roseateles koreensis]MDC8785341.1 response regulator [Roseateles koreensis]
MRLLLVEDSEKLSTLLKKALQQGGYAVDCSMDGLEADFLLATQRYDAVVLDLSLPGMDGLDVLARLRERNNKTPVLALTARGELEDRVKGLNMGADDYLAKPFDLVELEARLHALIRRAHGGGAPVLNLGPLAYESSGRLFTLKGEKLLLRPKEHAVLEALMLRAGKAVSKSQLYEHVFSIDDNTGQDVVEIYIHRLRRQLAHSGVAIVTLRGLGYVLEAQAQAQALAP